VLILAGALDYLYGWYKHEKSLRMTKQELKEEFRQQEGDPMVKGQRRRAARALAHRRIAAEVPRADVVVTNPTHFAVALRYEREKSAAPVVVAKGADLMAKRIRELAAAKGVAVVENPPLARALYRAVEPGRAIPPELFRAVAELLAYVYRQREQAH
jgi:flagellar biosynthetic protein FlhB